MEHEIDLYALVKFPIFMAEGKVEQYIKVIENELRLQFGKGVQIISSNYILDVDEATEGEPTKLFLPPELNTTNSGE